MGSKSIHIHPGKTHLIWSSTARRALSASSNSSLAFWATGIQNKLINGTASREKKHPLKPFTLGGMRTYKYSHTHEQTHTHTHTHSCAFKHTHLKVLHHRASKVISLKTWELVFSGRVHLAVVKHDSINHLPLRIKTAIRYSYLKQWQVFVHSIQMQLQYPNVLQHFYTSITPALSKNKKIGSTNR